MAWTWRGACAPCPVAQRLPLVLLSSGFMPSGTDGTRLFNARLLKPARQVQLFETLARCLSPRVWRRSPQTNAGIRCWW
jgi:hypothetical protein